MVLSEEQPELLKKEDYLKESLVFQNTCVCRGIYDAGVTLSALHLHEFLEISVVVAGCGIHRVWNEATECQKGDVYVIRPGIPHRYFARDPQNVPTVCNLVFDAENCLAGESAQINSKQFCCGIFQRNASVAHIPLKRGQLEMLEHLFHVIEEENANREPEWQAVIKAELTHILLKLKRFQQNAEQMPPLKSKEKELTAETVRYVMEHFSENTLTLEAIADSLYVSKSYLSKMFHNVTGEHFSAYLRNVRLKQVCFLLKTTELTNEQIVQRCGMKDLSSFYHLFQSEFGMTPGQYRKNTCE